MADTIIEHPKILKAEKITAMERLKEDITTFRGRSEITSVKYRITTEKGVYDIHSSWIRNNMIPAVGYSIRSDINNKSMYFVFKARQY